MVQIPHQTSGIPVRKIGIESYHGFGDGLFQIPLIKAVSKGYGTPIGVATKPACADAFHNIPEIDEIITIPEMGRGDRAFREKGYGTTYQCTPNAWFYHFRNGDPNLSLIDMVARIGLHYGFPAFDQQPIFIPTQDELNAINLIGHDPYIAIESVYHSGQSWAGAADFEHIMQKYPAHKILWLSQTGHPHHPRILPTQSLSRRQLICCLHRADTFFSVGSGFFCASLALPPHLQPKKIVCLWIDDLYKYENRLSHTKWHNNITWIHNPSELRSL